MLRNICSHKCSNINCVSIVKDKYSFYEKASNEEKLIKLKSLYENRVKKKEGCWEWIGALNKQGYGKLTWDKKTMPAHRVSYMIHIGYIPKNHVIMHICDNPPCTNPNHLKIGTHKDNVLDCKLKNRLNRNKGEKNSQSKLNHQSVNEIKKLIIEQILSLKEISNKFNVSVTTIRHIKNKKNWKE